MSLESTPGAVHPTLPPWIRAAAERGRTVLFAPWFAPALLVLLALGLAALQLHLTRDTTLLDDDWTWALHRRGDDVGTFLRPYNSHLSLIPLVVYRVLFATAGLDHWGAFRLVAVLGHLTCVALLFAYARPRVGGLVALVLAGLLLFDGPAAQNILWPFQVGWTLSLAAAVGALLALDREDRRGDAVACGLTAAALASSGLGLPIAVGLLVETLWGRRSWRAGWIVGGPLALYALWWVGYQTDVTSAFREAAVLTPQFVVGAPANVLSSLLGLAGKTKLEGPADALRWGAPLLLVAAPVVALRLRQLPAVPTRVLTLATMLLAFWVGTALERAFFGGPSSGRYIYVGSLLMLLLAAELLRGVPVRGWALTILGVVAALAALSNLKAFDAAASDYSLRAPATRAEVGALDLTRGLVRPDYASKGFFLIKVTAGAYFAAERAYGTPAYSAAQIAAAPEPVREQADAQLVAIHGPRLQPTRRGTAGAAPEVADARNGSARTGGGCVTLIPAPRGDGLGRFDVVLPPAGVTITGTRGQVAVGLRRFGAELQPLGVVAAPRRRPWACSPTARRNRGTWA